MTMTGPLLPPAVTYGENQTLPPVISNWMQVQLQTHIHIEAYIQIKLYSIFDTINHHLRGTLAGRSVISSFLDHQPLPLPTPPPSLLTPLSGHLSLLPQYGTLVPPSPPPAPKRGDKKPLPPPPSPPQILYISLGHMPQLSHSLTQVLIDGLSPQPPTTADGLSPQPPTNAEPLRVLWMLPPEQRTALPPRLPPNFRVKTMTDLPHLQVRFKSLQITSTDL